MREDGDFTAFVASRGEALLRLGWLLTTDADAAQDLVQEALTRAVPAWDRIAPGAREAYVRATMRSVWIDGWRRRRGWKVIRVAEVGELGDVGGRSGADGRDPADGVGRLTLDAALARLTPRQRTVLVLRFYEDLTEAQTARAMGVTVGTVKSQTRHSLDRLRTLSPDLAEAFGRSWQFSEVSR